jgi:hypothetical protein
MKVMREVIGLDDTNDRGQRVFDASTSAPLLGFDFNGNSGISQTMYFPYEVTGAGADVTLSIMPINSAPLANQAAVAGFPAAPTAASLVVGVVGINFYQQVNGKFYPLNNNSTNPLAIEYVA